jgi:hypothetical protein
MVQLGCSLRTLDTEVVLLAVRVLEQLVAVDPVLLGPELCEHYPKIFPPFNILIDLHHDTGDKIDFRLLMHSLAAQCAARNQLASVPLSAGPVYSSKLPVVLTRRLCDICTKTIVQATQRRRCGHHWRDPPPARRRRGGGSRTHQELHSDVGRAMITCETVSA